MSTSHHTPTPESSVFHHAEGLTLYTGDPLTILRNLQDGSVDCVVTSPPPWQPPDDTTRGSGEHTGCPHLTSTPTTPPGDARRCGRGSATPLTAREDLDSTVAGYVEALRQVFTQVYRVIVPSGTVWVHLGDGSTTTGTPLGMPWRVALTLQADGWILRNAIICHHPDTTLRNRLTCRYQLLFLLARQPRYFFHLDPIRQHYTGERPLSRRAHHHGTKPHTATGAWPPPGVTETHLRGRNPGDVWTIPTEAAATGHPTAPPLELPTRCIAAGCPPSGTVLDPFSGTATTGLAARRLGRTYIGIDTNPDHHTTALHRLGLTPPDDDRCSPSPAATSAATRSTHTTGSRPCRCT